MSYEYNQIIYKCILDYDVYFIKIGNYFMAHF